MARFQAGALAIRPTTSWTRPTIGGRVKSAFGGLKRRAKNLLARPGIQKAMNSVGSAAGHAVGWTKGAASTAGNWARQKTGFSASNRLVEFRRRRLGSRLRRRRKPTFGGHAGKGAAYGAATGAATGAALGGAGTYHAARKMGMSRGAALGAGIVGGALGGVQGTLSGALTGGTLGAATYGAKRIRRGD
ncbi:hypothetical protein [Allocoleopsis sp.]|uniref:hypothetical protein n=1 Tax=Allocoleopsis sp. TaxID=3088169 RepID=UPI002FD0C127